MARLDFLHICNDAFLTAGTNSLNVIGIFDRITAQKLPVGIPKLSLAMGITALDGPHDILIVLKKDLKELGRVQGSYQGPNHQHIHHFIGLGFPEAGEYIFEVSVDGELLGTKRPLVNKTGE